MRTGGDRGSFGEAHGVNAVRLGKRLWLVAAAMVFAAAAAIPSPVGGDRAEAQAAPAALREFPIPGRSHPHDVAPTPDGAVWYTAQTAGALGRLDPGAGKVRQVKLGEGSAPHGIIVGPDGALWVTDGGVNAILRVSARSGEIRRFPLPAARASANLNTAAFDRAHHLWFTGQSGVFGRVTPSSGRVEVWDAPRGPGPYGITVTPQGAVYYASLAGSYVGRIDAETAAVTVLQPPTAQQGARRIWSDARGRLWVSEWNAGNLARYDPATRQWKEWRLPGERPMPYAVYVDDQGMVWLSDWGANALVRFDPASETFTSVPFPSEGAAVRQLNGRPGEVWGAESGVDKLVAWRRH